MTRDLDCIRFVTRHFHDLQGLRYWVPLGLITLSVGGGATYFSNTPWVLLRAGLFVSAFLLALGAKRYYTKTFGEVESQVVTPEPYPVPIFSPAGPLSPLAGLQQFPPIARHFLTILGLALALFFVLQAVTPTITVLTEESLVQPPWATLDVVFLAHEPWTLGVNARVRPPSISPSTAAAVLGQTALALYGALFLGIWLWRRRRLSQSYHLILGITLVGLSIFGTCLGYLVWEDRNLPRFLIDLFLPTVIHPWVALLLCGSSMILAGLLDHWQLVRVLGRRTED